MAPKQAESGVARVRKKRWSVRIEIVSSPVANMCAPLNLQGKSRPMTEFCLHYTPNSILEDTEAWGDQKGATFDGASGSWGRGIYQGQRDSARALPCPQGHPSHACHPPCLSHQVQVIHVAAAPGLPVGTSASPCYHDDGIQGTGHQWAVAL